MRRKEEKKAKPCSCGCEKTEQWFRQKNGQLFEQTRCPECGKEGKFKKKS